MVETPCKFGAAFLQADFGIWLELVVELHTATLIETWTWTHLDSLCCSTLIKYCQWYKNYLKWKENHGVLGVSVSKKT